MKKNYKLLLWDMDGTLMDSQQGLMAGMRHTLECFHLPAASDETLRSFLGPSLLYTFRNYYGLPEETAAEAVQVFRRWFVQYGIYDGNHPYEGIPELLQDLQAAGYRMAIATSKLESFAVQIAEHFHLAHFFDFIGGCDAERTRPEKPEVIAWTLAHCPDVSREEVLMIGDRAMDVIGAAANQIDVAAVLYGYGTREELQAAQYWADDVAALRKLLLG